MPTVSTYQRWQENVIGNAMFRSRQKPKNVLYAGGNQPSRRDFGLSDVSIGTGQVAVETRDLLRSPFFRLVEFTAPDIRSLQDLLIVAPLSGHFAVLLRDLIAGLVPHFRVYIMDWTNIRHVPARYGPYSLEKNIASVLDAVKALPAGLHIIGLCQGGVPALAATAVLSRQHPACAPASLVLMGSPVDPLSSPTHVVQLLRSRPLSWFEDNLVASVSDEYAGSGRRVYPADRRLLPLWAYLTRHISEGSDTGRKVLFDDGADPSRFPFLDLFTSIMDLDAAYFLENTRDVFHDRLMPEGALIFEGEPVDLEAIRTAALLTIEGERDDITAPGQTSVAHSLCSALPDGLHRSLVVPRAGHFSLFYGDIWRRTVLPAICDFCCARERGSLSACQSAVRI